MTAKARTMEGNENMKVIPPPEPPPGVKERFDAMFSRLSQSERTQMLVNSVMAKMRGDTRHGMVISLEWAANGKGQGPRPLAKRSAGTLSVSALGPRGMSQRRKRRW